MKLTGFRENDLFNLKYNKLSAERQKRVDDTKRKLVNVLVSADNPAGIPEPLNKPSHTKPFRRANIDGDLRLYWWIKGTELVFHDIVDHKQAKKYKDVHK